VFSAEEFIPKPVVSKLGIRVETTGQAGDGLSVDDVHAGSRAARLGLRKGDVIYEVNGQQVSTAGDLDQTDTAQVLEVDVSRAGKRVELLLAPPGAPLPMFLGITTTQVSSKSGLIVTAVTQESVASRAGLEPGDVIRAMDGHELGDADMSDIASALEQAGATSEISILRSGKPVELTASFEGTPGPRRLGINATPLPDENSVVVSSIYEGSVGSRAGLKEGDVIRAIDGREVRDADTLVLALALASETPKLSLRRGGKPLALTASFLAPTSRTRGAVSALEAVE
jgi:S1-C subfamily serine protease